MYEVEILLDRDILANIYYGEKLTNSDELIYWKTEIKEYDLKKNKDQLHSEVKIHLEINTVKA